MTEDLVTFERYQTLAVPPALVVMIGAPGSGKSTLAQAWFRPTQILSLDGLRAQLTDNPSDMTVEADVVRLRADILDIRLSRGLTTCIDATNVRTEYRAELLAAAARHQVPAHAVVVETFAWDCRKQNEARRDAGGRYVPSAVVRKLYTAMRESVGYHGPVPGFHVTRRLRLTPEYDSRVYGRARQYRGAPWLA